jgi:formate dehydrogenase iron-sulfur subunit
MSRAAILMDTGRCVECQACRIACQNLNQLPPEQAYLKFMFVEQGEYPQVNHFIARYSCMNCGEAPCVKVCPTGTLYKGENGFTYVDKDKCSGCAYCTNVCPYQVPHCINNKVSKCEGCLTLVAEGSEPACVNTCISNALKFGDRDELVKLGLERANQLLGKHPHANLYGTDQLGGLGLLLILRDRPEAYGLPVNPVTDKTLGWWKELVQPGGLLLATAAFAASGLSFVVAKRNHEKELDE